MPKETIIVIPEQPEDNIEVVENNDDTVIIEVDPPARISLVDNPIPFILAYASKSVYGLVKVGDGIKVDNGVISVDSSTGGVGTVKSVNTILPGEDGNVQTLFLVKPGDPQNMQVFIDYSDDEEVLNQPPLENSFGTGIEIYQDDVPGDTTLTFGTGIEIYVDETPPEGELVYGNGRNT